MEEQKKKPKRVDWQAVRRRIRLWMPSVSATVFWLGRTAREWWYQD